MRRQVGMKVCFCEITQFPNRRGVNPRVLMSGCVLSSHLSSYFHKLPPTCRTFTRDDNIHSSLCVDTKMDVMAQISQKNSDCSKTVGGTCSVSVERLHGGLVAFKTSLWTSNVSHVRALLIFVPSCGE